MKNNEIPATRRRYYEIGLELEKQLKQGQYQPGQKLPSERKLSELFNTSRATIREAIIMLELEGLVEVKQGAGLFFRNSHYDAESTINNFTPELKVSEVGPFELLQARFVLETSIAEFAAKNIKISELRELREIIRKQESSLGDDSALFEQLDREFHLCIAEATQNRVLIDTAKRMWNVVRTENVLWKQLNIRYLHEQPLKESWLNEHKAIFAALQQRDPTMTRNAMLKHLEHGRSELEKLVDFKDVDTLDLDDFFFLNHESESELGTGGSGLS